MTKLHVLLAALVLAISGLIGVGSVSPASAGPVCETSGFICPGMTHRNPDPGNNRPFLISCAWGVTGGRDGYSHYIYEGDTSKNYCKDMDGVYVLDNQEIWCIASGSWIKAFDATGWHKVNDSWPGGTGGNPLCESRAD